MTTDASAPSPRDEYLYSLAMQACIYCWPLYEMQRMRAATSARKAPQLGFAGATPEDTQRWCNLFTSARALLHAGDRRVVMPNNDTLYVNAWLDLGEQPLVLSVPATGPRYYVLGLLDFFTNPFGHVGTRTTGNAQGQVLVSGPGWSGDVPAPLRGAGRHLRSATRWVWIIGRILVDGEADVAAVNALQDQFAVQTLEDWAEGRASAPRRFDSRFGAHAPLEPEGFVAMVNDALRMGPVPADEAALLAQFRPLGIGPEPDQPLTPAARAALARALHHAKALLERPEGEIFTPAAAAAPAQPQVGWRAPLRLGTSYGHDYLLRAFVARQAIGALETREAAYPRCETDASGQALDGRHRYTLHFAPDQLPPVDAFWSITLYRASDCLLVANPIDRYAIGDRTQGLEFDADGGLTLTLQHAQPQEATARANWLPAPAEAFFLCLRAYLPRPPLLDGRYRLPDPVRQSR